MASNLKQRAVAKKLLVVPDSVKAKAGKPVDRKPVITPGKPIPLDFVPTSEAEMAMCLSDPMWRVCSGQLYKIMVKEPVNGQTVIPFRPNRAQRRFMASLWHRNVILKARQLGFTTLISIMWLDHALFVPDQRCVIVAQDLDAAESFFRDKIAFAYDRLPKALQAAMPLTRRTTSELLFANNSSIKVSTSARSGTPHRLHISEFGKIGAEDPHKAKEVITGSFPAVPLDGIIVVESTAEGQSGEFYNLTQAAIKKAQSGSALTQIDFRFHFFPWWQEPGYTLDGGVVITDADTEYFTEIEAEMRMTLTPGQRRWYVATRDSTFSGESEKMWQEYPSTPKEPFKVSTEGLYYAVQLAAMRKHKRLCKVPHVPGVPVNTFWDIGNTDGTAIWLHQRIGFENRFIGFIEGWGESYSFFIGELQKTKYVWGKHYLPHDAAHKRQQGEKVASPQDELEALGLGGDWEIVPRVSELIHGIQKTRDVFSQCWFDEEKCAAGIKHLDNYRKTWNRQTGTWRINTANKVEGHSEAADALRQFAQGYEAPSMRDRRDSTPSTPRRNWRVS